MSGFRWAMVYLREAIGVKGELEENNCRCWLGEATVGINRKRQGTGKVIRTLAIKR